MVWFILAQIFSTLVSLIHIGRMTESDKDLEIMILRYQLAIADRKMKKPFRANRAERMTLAVLAARLKRHTDRPVSQFTNMIRLVQPETVFRWHLYKTWCDANGPKGARENEAGPLSMMRKKT